MRTVILFVAIVCLFGGGLCQAQVPAYLIDTLVNPDGINNFFVCATFDDEFKEYDLPGLTEFIKGFACGDKFFRVIFVPHSEDSYKNCEKYASRFDAWIFKLSKADREKLKLKYAPSMSVVDSKGILTYSSTSFDDQLRDAIAPSGTLKIVCKKPQLKTRRIIFQHEKCLRFKYSLNNTDTSFSVPAGVYKYKAKGKSGTITVDPNQVESFYVSADTRPKPKTLSRYRRTGPFYIGLLHWGAQTFTFKEGTDEDVELYPTIGIGLRYFGVGGVEGRVLTSVVLDEDDKFDKIEIEGYAFGGELAPAFLCKKDYFSICAKGGYYILKPKTRGPSLLRDRVKYEKPYVGGGIFLGRLGRIRNSAKWRLGVSLAVLYSERITFTSEQLEVEVPPGEDASKVEMGGISFAAEIQFEF